MHQTIPLPGFSWHDVRDLTSLSSKAFIWRLSSWSNFCIEGNFHGVKFSRCTALFRKFTFHECMQACQYMFMYKHAYFTGLIFTDFQLTAKLDPLKISHYKVPSRFSNKYNHLASCSYICLSPTLLFLVEQSLQIFGLKFAAILLCPKFLLKFQALICPYTWFSAIF